MRCPYPLADNLKVLHFLRYWIVKIGVYNVRAISSIANSSCRKLRELCMGLSIYVTHKKIVVFDPPSPVHVSLTLPPPPHAVDMKYT